MKSFVTPWMVLAVFCVELLLMILFSFFGVREHGIWLAIVDAVLLSVIVGPLIYWWLIKPYEAARKEAIGQFRFSEQRFKDFALSSGDWFWEMGPNLRFTYLSDRFSQVTGMSPEQFLGKTRWEASSVSAKDAVWIEHFATLEAREPFKNFRYSAKGPDGSVHHFSVSGVPNFDEKGNFLGYRGTSSDVTSIVDSEEHLNREVQMRKETEAFLRKELDENRLLIAVIEASPSAIMISEFKDAQAHLVYGNKAVTELTGYEKEEIRGRDPFFILGGKTDPAVWDELSQAMVDGKRIRREVLCYRKDGSTFWNSMMMFPINETRGEGQHIVIINVDITARIVMDEEREQMMLRAMESSKIESLGTLAGGIAHEINTPIQYIGDNLVFLNGEAEKVFTLLECYDTLCHEASKFPELAEHAQTIDKKLEELGLDIEFLHSEVPSAISQSLAGVERVAHIVKAVKEFSHPGAKELQNASLNQLLENVATITRNQWKYVAEMETKLDPDLPLIECNPDELSQVFVNLIINASQAIEEEQRNEAGTITIVTCHDDENVYVAVSDDGPGIPEADLERIFDLFYTSKPPGKGTGQGLAISQSIVNNHNGKIKVDSKLGHGVTFTIALPITQKTIGA